MADLPDLSDPSTLLQQYATGTSCQQLARLLSLHRATIYRRMLKATDADTYHEMITDALINRIADADEKLEQALTSCDIARAREQARFARMDFERKRPKLYGPKQEVSMDTTINVNIPPPPPPLHIDKPVDITAQSTEVIDNIDNNS